MVTVDHHPRPFGPPERSETGNTTEDAPAAEQQLTYENQVMVAGAGCGEEAIGEAVERLGRDPLDGDPSLLFPAGELATRTVKLSVAREDPQLAATPRRRCHQPYQE